VTFTSDLQNLIRSLVGASEYSVRFIKIVQAFMRYHGNNICPDEQMNAADEQPDYMMPLLTVSGGKSIKITISDGGND